MSRSVGTAFDALGDPTRRAVVTILCKGPRRPSEIADDLAITRPAMSRHLRVLRDAGIVREEIQSEDARARTVELLPEPFLEMRTWLDDVASFWEGQLGAFKAHAERTASTRKRKR